MMTDIGMNWPFESVIWADFQSVRNRFITGLQRWKIEQKLSGKYIINALLVEINIQTWMSETIENISFTWTLK
jgi:calcineurin-like phosphoesterase